MTNIQSVAGLAVFLLIQSLCLSGCARAATIRVLILDDSYKTAPDIDSCRKVDDSEGKALLNGNEYSGKIEVFRGKAGLFVINEIPLEEYVKSVVKAEVGKNWPAEALKAQAVTVRTYALYNMQHNNGNLYDVTSSSLSQNFRGPVSDPEVDEAVDSTRGEIIVYDGKPINAMYHSTSGGRTELPEEVFGKSYPYLKSIKTECSTSPYYRWERRIPVKEIEKALSVKKLSYFGISSLTSTGRAKKLRVLADNRNFTIQAKNLRALLGWKRLPSTWFSLYRSGDTFVFNGRGYGHGVGMCQWSAMEMALKGKSYREILSTFYPNTTISLYEN